VTVLALILLVAGLFPCRVVDLNQRRITLYLRLFERMAVFRWKSQIAERATVPNHVNSFGGPDAGIEE
jgi:hypothetical protein